MKDYSLIIVPGSKHVAGWRNDYFFSKQIAFLHIDEAKTESVYIVKARIRERRYERGEKATPYNGEEGITEFRQDIADVVNSIKFDELMIDNPQYIKDNASRLKKSLESLAKKKKFEVSQVEMPYESIRAA